MFDSNSFWYKLKENYFNTADQEIFFLSKDLGILSIMYGATLSSDDVLYLEWTQSDFPEIMSEIVAPNNTDTGVVQSVENLVKNFVSDGQLILNEKDALREIRTYFFERISEDFSRDGSSIFLNKNFKNLCGTILRNQNLFQKDPVVLFSELTLMNVAPRYFNLDETYSCEGME